MSIITTTELSDLVGYSFDEKELRRAKATIKLVETAATGIVGKNLDFDVHPLVVSVVTSACMRLMQNKAGVSTETIGSFNAQYPTGGRIFTAEETKMLKEVKVGGYGSIPVVSPYAIYEEN